MVWLSTRREYSRQYHMRGKCTDRGRPVQAVLVACGGSNPQVRRYVEAKSGSYRLRRKFRRIGASCVAVERTQSKRATQAIDIRQCIRLGMAITRVSFSPDPPPCSPRLQSLASSCQGA
jgi:hypothetical protein